MANLCLSVSENLSPTNLRELFPAYPFVNRSEKSAMADRKSEITAAANNLASAGCGPL
jgi:hypothetical protein